MLKFVQNGESKQPRPLVGYRPAYVYGHSAESPSEFQSGHSLVAGQSYVNPYLLLQDKRVVCLPLQKLVDVNPAWTHKVHLHALDAISPAVQTQLRQQQQLNHSIATFGPRRFHRTRGEFTDFLNRNKDYSSIGPIHGDQRTQQRILLTKSLIFSKATKVSASSWNRGKQLNLLSSNYPSVIYNTLKDSSSMLQNSFKSNTSYDNKQLSKSIQLYKSNLLEKGEYNDGDLSLVQSGVIKKSIERQRIRQNRLKTNFKFANSLQQRKKHDPKVFYFPKITPGQVQVMGLSEESFAPRYDRLTKDCPTDYLAEYQKSQKNKFT